MPSTAAGLPSSSSASDAAVSLPVSSRVMRQDHAWSGSQAP